jgi:hypothetical protein
LSDFGTKSVGDGVKNEFAGVLAKVHDARVKTDSVKLQRWLDVLFSASSSTLIAQAQIDYIKSKMLSDIQNELAQLALEASISNSIKSLLSQSDWILQVESVVKVLGDVGTKTVGSGVQNEFASALVKVHSDRPRGDLGKLTRWSEVLSGILAGKLVAQVQVDYIKSRMVPEVQVDIEQINLESSVIASIKNLLTQSDWGVQIEGIAKVLSDVGVKAVGAGVQNEFINVLTKVHAARLKSNLDKLNRWLQVLSSLQGSLLVTKEQQDSIQARMVSDLLKEIEGLKSGVGAGVSAEQQLAAIKQYISSALAVSDLAGKVEAIRKLNLALTNKTVGQDAQALVLEALAFLCSHVPETDKVLGPNVLNLLKECSIANWLLEEQRIYIKETLCARAESLWGAKPVVTKTATVTAKEKVTAKAKTTTTKAKVTVKKKK